MSKFGKITLLLLAAFFVFGFSISAIAARPDKQQTLMSAPLSSYGIYCLVANTTEEEIAVDMVIYISTGPVVDTTHYAPAKQVLGAGDAVNFTPGYCVVSWNGQKGDVSATLCAQETAETQTCLEMN